MERFGSIPLLSQLSMLQVTSVGSVGCDANEFELSLLGEKALVDMIVYLSKQIHHKKGCVALILLESSSSYHLFIVILLTHAL